MSRRYARRGTALLLVLALLLSMLGAALPLTEKTKTASGAFATAYTALLEKAPVVQADLAQEPYGLCRLLVTGYSGKDYGAVAAAETDGLAILQYDTPAAARKAATLLQKDGAEAEPDSLCQLETDTDLTGNLCDWASEMVGTAAFCTRRQIPGQSVVVAQIDTGFMLEHPALQGRLASNGIDLSGDGRSNAGYDTKRRGSSYCTQRRWPPCWWGIQTKMYRFYLTKWCVLAAMPVQPLRFWLLWRTPWPRVPGC